MAIIICDNCKKKYSDTLSACIHCGHPKEIVKNQLSNDKAAKSVPKAKVEEKTTEAKKVYLSDLSSEYVGELEAEFLARDEWALKFEQKRRANAMFRNMSMFSIGISLLSFSAIRNLAFLVKNDFMLYITEFWIIALFAFGIVGTIVFFIRGIVRFFGKKQGAYDEKWKKWLCEEKNIFIKDLEDILEED